MARLSIYLERLSHNQRDVIILKFQQGLSYKEINIITGLTTSNIGVLIHTGLKRLNEWLPEDFRP
jgi:RNA polymerase sigma-70 factor (ECF subfamily)